MVNCGQLALEYLFYLFDTPVSNRGRGPCPLGGGFSTAGEEEGRGSQNPPKLEEEGGGAGLQLNQNSVTMKSGAEAAGQSLFPDTRQLFRTPSSWWSSAIFTFEEIWGPGHVWVGFMGKLVGCGGSATGGFIGFIASCFQVQPGAELRCPDRCAFIPRQHQ